MSWINELPNSGGAVECWWTLFGVAARTLAAAIDGFNHIQNMVNQGFLVRTRADIGTRESRANDSRRREQAFASGAQFISTDYPEPNPRFSSYRVRFEGGLVVRTNPVNGDAALSGVDLERQP